MNATVLVISIYYILVVLGLIIAYSAWWVTRKKEDHIWRLIFTCLGGLIFATTFWFAYFLGAHNVPVLAWLMLVGTFVWFYIVLSTRTNSNLTRSVFAFFGTFVVAMTVYGGFSAGTRGWWGMAIPFYGATLWTVYSLLEVA